MWPSRPGTLSEEDARGGAKRSVSRALVAALAESGTAQETLAAVLGVSRARVRAFCDEHDLGASLGAHDLLLSRQRLPRLAAALDRRLAPGACAKPGMSLLAHAALVAGECGDVARAAHEALLDGAVDDTERRRVLREIAEAQRALDAMRAEVEG